MDTNDKIHEILYDEKYNSDRIIKFEKMTFDNILYQFFKIKFDLIK